MSLTSATLASDNTVYAQLIMDLGPEAVCEAARRLGITTKLDCYPAEGLGGLTRGVTTLEMANAYATLASGGIRHRADRDPAGRVPRRQARELGKPEGLRVMTDGQAYEVTEILEQNIQSGTGTRANYGCPAAGKTGTTDEAKDAWFVGYTPQLSTAVWVGYPDAGVAMPGAQGGEYAAPVWGAFMDPASRRLLRGLPAPGDRVRVHSRSSGSTPPARPTAAPTTTTTTRTSSRPTTRSTTRRRPRRRPRSRPRRPRTRRSPRPRRAPAAPGAAAWHPTGRNPPAVAERRLIEAIQQAIADRSGRLLRWSGDDAAVVRARPLAVTSIDTVVDGVHFSLATHTPADVGWKALATALSDLAAMGADPGEAYVSLVLPGGFEGGARAGGGDGGAGGAPRRHDRRRRRGARACPDGDRGGDGVGRARGRAGRPGRGAVQAIWSA